MFNNSSIQKVFSSSFATGKSTFQTNKPIADAGDYISRIKARAVYCKYPLKCNDRLIVKNYNALHLLEKAKLDEKLLNNVSVGAKNLNLNLFTKLDLENVCVVRLDPSTCPTDININNNFITSYTIDPNGELFGNDICGLYNFQSYWVPYSANEDTNIFNK
jgi:hypothetical protein